LIGDIPTQEVPTVAHIQKLTQGPITKVILSFSTPTGITRVWFDPDKALQLAELIMAETKSAGKPTLQVARVIPPADLQNGGRGQ
jgi:hypothetical protein